MSLPTASDNPFASLLITEGSAPSSPAAGKQRVFIDSSDHLLKYKNSGGTVSTVGTGLSDPMTTRGDIIVRNASNVTARLAIGSSGKVLSSDGTDVSWQTPSAGATHSYVGYNTIGGSLETTTANRWYTKRITLASAGTLTSLGAYIKWGADDLGAIMAGVFEDASGPVPNKAMLGTLIGTGNSTVDLSEAAGTRNPRWFHLPIGLYLAAGSYWIGFAFTSGTTQPTLYYDGSGSDRYWTPGGFRLLDGAYSSQTDSTRIYSIRGDLLA